MHAKYCIGYIAYASIIYILELMDHLSEGIKIISDSHSNHAVDLLISKSTYPVTMFRDIIRFAS